MTPAKDASPVSGPLGTGDGPKERTIKSFSFTNTVRGGKVIEAAGMFTVFEKITNFQRYGSESVRIKI